jgi:hypothetical protein
MEVAARDAKARDVPHPEALDLYPRDRLLVRAPRFRLREDRDLVPLRHEPFCEELGEPRAAAEHRQIPEDRQENPHARACPSSSGDRDYSL